LYFKTLKQSNYHWSILNRNPNYFFINFFIIHNFKTFKLSLKYPTHKYSIIVFIKSFYIFNFKTFKLSFKYPKQKFYFLKKNKFFLYFENFKIIKLYLKYLSKNRNKVLNFFYIIINAKQLNYTWSILNRNPNYYFFFYKIQSILRPNMLWIQRMKIRLCACMKGLLYYHQGWREFFHAEGKDIMAWLGGLEY